MLASCWLDTLAAVETMLYLCAPFHIFLLLLHAACRGSRPGALTRVKQSQSNCGNAFSRGRRSGESSFFHRPTFRHSQSFAILLALYLYIICYASPRVYQRGPSVSQSGRAANNHIIAHTRFNIIAFLIRVYSA